MQYAIENTSGQWWSGKCWGVKQARELYGPTELPIKLPYPFFIAHEGDEEFKISIWVNNLTPEGVDAGYSGVGDDEIIAKVYRV